MEHSTTYINIFKSGVFKYNDNYYSTEILNFENHKFKIEIDCYKKNYNKSTAKLFKWIDNIGWSLILSCNPNRELRIYDFTDEYEMFENIKTDLLKIADNFLNN